MLLTLESVPAFSHRRRAAAFKPAAAPQPAVKQSSIPKSPGRQATFTALDTARDLLAR